MYGRVGGGGGDQRDERQKNPLPSLTLAPPMFFLLAASHPSLGGLCIDMATAHLCQAASALNPVLGVMPQTRTPIFVCSLVVLLLFRGGWGPRSAPRLPSPFLPFSRRNRIQVHHPWSEYVRSYPHPPDHLLKQQPGRYQ